MATRTCMPQTDFQTLLAQVDFKSLLEREVPALRGRIGERYSREVACPFCGGTTRFRYRAASERYQVERVFCSHCAPRGLTAVQFVMRRYDLRYGEAVVWLTNQSMRLEPLRVVPCPPDWPLPMRVALAHHHRKPDTWRNYFRSRGITDDLIDRYRLGYSGTRYAIPCFLLNQETGEEELWGIQYRIRPQVEGALKAQGVKITKYLSERGSHNHRLFNADFVNSELPQVLVVEGPLDCITLRRFGIPAVATFQGNNKAKAWDTHWNAYLKQVATVLVIPDNDSNGMGELFARQKSCDIPRSHIHRLPPGVKDVGELIGGWLKIGMSEPEIQANLNVWLDRPNIRNPQVPMRAPIALVRI